MNLCTYYLTKLYNVLRLEEQGVTLKDDLIKTKGKKRTFLKSSI